MDSADQNKLNIIIRHATNQIPYGMIVFDTHSRIFSWNLEAEEIFEYTYKDVIGQPIHQYFLLQDQLKATIEETEKAFKNNQVPNIKKEFHHICISKSGEQKKLGCTLKPFSISNQTFMVLSIQKVDTDTENSDGMRTDRRGFFTDQLSYQKNTEDNSGSEWLLSYVDVMTLLVVLFVLIYSLTDGALKSDTEQVKETISEQIVSISNKGGTQVIAQQPESGEGLLGKGAAAIAVKAQPSSPLSNNEGRRDKLITSIEKSAIAEQLDVIETDTSISLRMKEKILFPSGEISMTESGENVLYELAKILAKEPYKISVEGHTDSSPISTTAISSNWELSSIRASAVVRYLIDGGIKPDRLRSIGYADTHPITQLNSNSQNNRRVELILHIDEKTENTRTTH